jgi:hypothetical protein
MLKTEALQKKIRLKGGSLSGTYLCANHDGEVFVRKEASLKEHREYGFQRWYSQLKRLQRYGQQFPGLFPNVIKFGCSLDLAYFDIEYVDGALTVHDFLLQNPPRESIEEMFSILQISMDQMHSIKIPSSASAIDLYVYEEMEQKMAACLKNPKFQQLIAERDVVFNHKKITGIYWAIDNFKKLIKQSYINPIECFTHGNLTLENILYQPDKKLITFIDPYEENIIDSRLAEYSQIFQSCSSHYELYNSLQPIFSDDGIVAILEVPPGISIFNEVFSDYLNSSCTLDELKVIRLLEVSQFVRMLPFKMEIDECKMSFFYSLASYLFDNFINTFE